MNFIRCLMAGLLSLLVSFQVFAADEVPVLSIDGYGLIKFGDKLSDVEKKLGGKAIKNKENYDDGIYGYDCGYVEFAKYPHVMLMVEKGVFTRVDGDLESSIGLRVGDNVNNFLKIYKGKICKTNEWLYDSVQLFVEQSCSLIITTSSDETPNLLFISKDGTKAIGAIEYEGKIQEIRGGLIQPVQYKEGCT